MTEQHDESKDVCTEPTEMTKQDIECLKFRLKKLEADNKELLRVIKEINDIVTELV